MDRPAPTLFNILGVGGVIWLTQSVEDCGKLKGWRLRGSEGLGDAGEVRSVEGAGAAQEVAGGGEAGQKANIFTGVVGGGFSGAADDEDGDGGDAAGELADEGRAGEAGQTQADDDQGQIAGERGLIDEDEGLTGVGGALDGIEVALQGGAVRKRLQGVVVDQEDGGPCCVVAIRGP